MAQKGRGDQVFYRGGVGWGGVGWGGVGWGVTETFLGRGWKIGTGIKFEWNVFPFVSLGIILGVSFKLLHPT